MAEVTAEQFKYLLNADSEHERLEFKEAKAQFNFDAGKKSVLGYCIALANEGGGKLILGVADSLPRQVVGTSAFLNIQNTQEKIFTRIRRRVSIQALDFEGKRVLIFDIPPRPIAEPLEFNGQFLMRVGESLEAMTSDQLKKIYSEAVSDYSASINNEINMDSFDQLAIAELRKLLKLSGRTDKNEDDFDDEQLLRDLNLLKNDGYTLASLILLGSDQALSSILPFAEIRYGYKLNESEPRNQDSQIYRQGYLLYYNNIWAKINARNINLSVPQGMLILEKKAFEEETIREAVSNMIIHRDYSEQESAFIFHTPTDIQLKNPGGLPEGVTVENIIDQSKPRNKLIADVLNKCGLVEAFGMGVNLIVKNQLKVGKSLPDYSESDKYHVVLDISGEIQDLRFTEYVYRVANDLQKSLNDEELRALYMLKDQPGIGNPIILNKLEKIGIVEKTEQNKYMLAKQYYEYTGEKGIYTRRKGLDKETCKELILKHLNHHKIGYMDEFIEVLRDVPKQTINNYLKELKDEGKIIIEGNPRISRGKNRAYWKLIQV